MDNVTILHSFLYLKIKENNSGYLININLLKSIIARTINMKGGIPRFLDKYIIEDLIKLKLIKRLNYNTYRILNSKCYKEVKKIVSLYY
jgi:hypothetical protein